MKHLILGNAEQVVKAEVWQHCGYTSTDCGEENDDQYDSKALQNSNTVAGEDEEEYEYYDEEDEDGQEETKIPEEERKIIEQMSEIEKAMKEKKEEKEENDYSWWNFEDP